MTRRSSRRSSVAVRRTVLGLMLGHSPGGSTSDGAGRNACRPTPRRGRPVMVDSAVVEQPRVLISEVLIEGIDGHP